MHNFRELDIWKKSLEFSKKTFVVTKDFPPSEMYGMVSQMNRASISIPSNIAEGASRDSNKDFNRFLQIAIGSAFELETQIILGAEFNFIPELKANELIKELNEIQRMMNGFRLKLKV
jgi:four helix bundle protein